MWDNIKRSLSRKNNPHILSFVALLLTFLAIPLTVFIARQQQDQRQEAAARTIELFSSTNRAPGRILVKYKDSAAFSTLSERVRSRYSFRKVGDISRIRTEVIEVNPGEENDLALKLSQDPDVEHVEPDYIYEAFQVAYPNDPEFAPRQYGLNNTGQVIGGVAGTAGADINAKSAWNKTKGSQDTKVAVLDTGISKSHSELSSKVTGRVNFSVSTTDDDIFGHGSHVAGIIAATTNNGTGVAGVCPECSLMSVKVLEDTQGQGTTSTITNGIIWAADNGADVINMSLGGGPASQTAQDAVNYAWNKGVVIVAAAGNCGDPAKPCPGGVNPITYPAAYPNVLSVAATDNKDAKTSYSNYGSWVDVAAPGHSIYSTVPLSRNATGYANISGTSMASPMVAGVAGLLVSQGLSNSSVVSKITSTADAIGGTGTYWIHGRVNAAAAVGAGGGGTDPTPTSGCTIATCPPSATPQPTGGPTQPPSPTGTPVPTVKPGDPTYTPVPTSPTAGVNFNLALTLHGLGNGGDNTNAGSKYNENPLTKERKVTVFLYDQNDAFVANATGDVTLGNGIFTGSISLGNVAQQSYIIKLHTGSYLKKRIPGIVSLRSTTYQAPALTLIAGDTNNDNKLNILDYNVIINCYSVDKPAKSCTAASKILADITDDGKVNQLDLNLFLRELSIQTGD